MSGIARGHRIRSEAFTLIELLLVVAVLSVLVGLLMPALGGARRSARRAQCMANERQLHLANDLYAGDHDDRYMPTAAGMRSTNLERWHGVRERAGQRFEPGGAPISAYLGSPGSGAAVRRCPSFAHVLDGLEERGKGFEAGCGGYGCNHAFVGSERFESAPGVWTLKTDRVGSLRSRFAGPSRTVGFADAALATDEVIEYSFVEPALWPEYPTFRPDPSVHFRHGSLANVAWLDGHVSSEPMTLSESSGMYPLRGEDVGIGWFGDASSNALFDYR